MVRSKEHTKTLRDHFTGSLTHGYLLVGSRRHVEPMARAYAESLLGKPIHMSPDAVFLSVDTLYIEDARGLVDRAYGKPSDGGKKFFILSFGNATHEAQNALLKFFEEPPAATHLFLIAPTPDTVLPTLRSRLVTHFISEDPMETENAEARSFLAADQRGRQAILAPILDGKDKGAASALLEGVEGILYSLYKKGAVQPSVLRDLELTRQYLSDRSASVKMLLEYAAATVPQVEL